MLVNIVINHIQNKSFYICVCAEFIYYVYIYI